MTPATVWLFRSLDPLLDSMVEAPELMGRILLPAEQATVTHRIVPADVDGDGDIDIVVSGNTELRLYSNDGAANFVNEWTIDTGVVLWAPVLLVDDIDGSGVLDLLWSTRDGLNIIRHLADPSGSRPIFLENQSLISNPVVVDLDGDDVKEIILSAGGTHVYSLNPDDEVELCQTVFQQGRKVVFDMEGDGDGDVVIGTTLFRNNGDGLLEKALSWPAGSPGRNAVLSHDLNGDGSEDLLLVAPLTVALNHGEGSFRAKMAFDNVPLSILSFGDLNGDGTLDAAGVWNGKVNLWFNETLLEHRDCNGNGAPDGCDLSFGVSLDCDGNEIPDECDITTQDCNGNREPDACDVSSNFSEDCNHNGIPDECDVATLDCNGNGVSDECDVFAGVSFTDSETVDGVEVGEDFHVVDLTADGVADIVTVTILDDVRSVVLYVNDGDGSFLAPERLEALSDGVLGGFGDIDDDGDLDVIAVSAARQEIDIFFTGDANERLPVRLPLLGVQHAVSGDWNADGLIDLAAIVDAQTGVSKAGPLPPVSRDYRLRVLQRSDSEEVWFDLLSEAYSVGCCPDNVFAVDIDGDGDDDIVHGTAGLFLCRDFCQQSAVTILVSNGEFGFEEIVFPENMVDLFSRPVVTSLNNDDLPDLVFLGGAPGQGRHGSTAAT
jgi:hypothetical protein